MHFLAVGQAVPLGGAQPRVGEMAPPTSSAPVLLGFAGRMVGGGERLDHRTTKITAADLRYLVDDDAEVAGILRRADTGGRWVRWAG